jgi:hypothetical protein
VRIYPEDDPQQLKIAWGLVKEGFRRTQPPGFKEPQVLLYDTSHGPLFTTYVFLRGDDTLLGNFKDGVRTELQLVFTQLEAMIRQARASGRSLEEEFPEILNHTSENRRYK